MRVLRLILRPLLAERAPDFAPPEMASEKCCSVTWRSCFWAIGALLPSHPCRDDSLINLCATLCDVAQGTLVPIQPKVFDIDRLAEDQL